jgi:hypothetical protein
VSTHAVPHVVFGAAHDGSWHVPPEHVWPAAHGVPHAPQCAASVCRFTQWPLQSSRPVLQPAAQWPASQTWPVVHAVVQSPQCCGSDCVSAQTPPPQSVSLPLHVEPTHWPAAHV